jgi:olfactory receptor
MSKKEVISFLRCAVQIFLAVAFGTTECFLLASMAYDRYVAIYNPLLYSVSMSPRIYKTLIIASYISRTLNATIRTVATSNLSVDLMKSHISFVIFLLYLLFPVLTLM